MKERLTDRARKSLQLANQEAHRGDQDFVGTEHLLLGLAKEKDGIAARALQNLGVDLEALRKEVDRHRGMDR